MRFMSESCTLTGSDKSRTAVIDSIRFVKEIFHTCFVNWIKYFIKNILFQNKMLFLMCNKTELLNSNSIKQMQY